MHTIYICILLVTIATKPPNKRNKFNLQVNTKMQAGNSAKSSSGSNDSMHQTSAALQKKSSADASSDALLNLLSSGKVKMNF